MTREANLATKPRGRERKKNLKKEKSNWSWGRVKVSLTSKQAAGGAGFYSNTTRLWQQGPSGINQLLVGFSTSTDVWLKVTCLSLSFWALFSTLHLVCCFTDSRSHSARLSAYLHPLLRALSTFQSWPQGIRGQGGVGESTMFPQPRNTSDTHRNGKRFQQISKYTSWAALGNKNTFKKKQKVETGEVLTSELTG